MSTSFLYPVELIDVIHTTDHGIYTVERSHVRTKSHGDFESEFAFCNSTGIYLGAPDFASRLVNKFGIVDFFPAKESHKIATVGYSNKSSMCYGWSNDKICGFRIGDKIFDPDFPARKGASFEKHGEKTIKTREECIQSAMNFALFANAPVRH